MSLTRIEAAARSNWHFKDQGSPADNSPTCVQTLWSKTNLTRDSAAGLSKLWSICPNTLGHTVWEQSQSFNQGFISLDIVIYFLFQHHFKHIAWREKKKKSSVKTVHISPAPSRHLRLHPLLWREEKEDDWTVWKLMKLSWASDQDNIK